MELLCSSPCTSILANPTLPYPFRLNPSRNGRNLSLFFLKNSSLKSYAVSRNIRLHVSASLPRRSRRNTLREKLVARELQVRQIPKSPTTDRNPNQTEMGDARGGHGSDLPVKEAAEVSSHVGEDEETAVDSTERSDLPPRDSAPWNEFENWVEQYKKDSDYWGIGSGPVFTVHRDSTGAITKVAVSEDEIVRRAGMSTLSRDQGDTQDPGVIEKISRAEAMARGILSGEYTLPKNSSVVKFEDTLPKNSSVVEFEDILPKNSSVVKFEDAKSSLVHNFQTVIPQGKTLLKSSPRIAFTLLCGYLLFWTAKKIWVVTGSSPELTSEEEEMLRRKLKVRKEMLARNKGSVEVIQNEELDQVASIRKPVLDKDELAKEISRSKTLTHVSAGPKLPNVSITTVDPAFEDRIKEIREMARKARESERQDVQRNSQNETAEADGGLNEVVDAPMNESGGRQPREVESEADCSVSQKLSSPSEASGNQFVSQQASSSSISPINVKHKLIRSVKEAREYLSRKNKIQQDRLLSPIDDNSGSKGEHGTDESNPGGKANQKIRETIGSVEIPEGDISTSTTTQSFSSESYTMHSKTKIGESIMDEDVTKDNHLRRKEDIRSSVLRNSHFSRDKPVASSSINGSGNRSPEGSHRNKETLKSRIEAASVENDNKSLNEGSISPEGNHKNKEMLNSRIESACVDKDNKSLNEGSISQESDLTKNDEPQQQEMNSKSCQVDNIVSDATSVTAVNGKGKPQPNGENLVLNSLDFSVPPIPMKKHVTEKEGADGVSSLVSPDSVGLSEVSSSTSHNVSINMKNERELISDGEMAKEHSGANPPEDSKSSSKNNWLEENFQEFEPVVEKIGSGFRENYLTAKVKAEENTIAKKELSELDLFDVDDEFEWMKDEKLKETVFQVRENELAGRNPFHLINDEDRAAFFKGLEKKADKLNTKLLELHEWIHSRIENLDYGSDGISLYDPPEKIIPRWKEPAVDRYPEFLKKSANAKVDSPELVKGSFDTTDKLKNSDGHLDGVPPYTSSLGIGNKSESNVTSRQKTVIECSDGTRKAGKKGANEQWQHTKKWSREFLEVYNSESDPEIKSILKDMGKDLDRWITEKEVQDVADLMTRIPAKKRQYIEKKLSKIEREMEMFGPQAVVSKYKEYSDEVEEDYLWWLDRKFVLFIEIYKVENNVQEIGFYSLEMAADLDLNPRQHHVIGFEDPGDSKNFCYIIQAHLEMLGKGSAFVVARPPKDAFREAKGNGFNVTVIRKGELKLNIDQPLEEVEEEIIEIGSKMYHDKIMHERGVDLRAVVKGVFASNSSKR